MRSKKISLILHSGTPYGVRSAELSNWNGKVIFCPRGAIKELRKLPESEMPAVYFLLGADRDMYVGETDELAKRIGNHATNKEFWDELVAFTSPNFTKTEVKYLEHVFAKKLQDDGLVKLQNATSPKLPTISKASMDILDDFVDTASDVLVSLGYDFVGVSRGAKQELSKGKRVFCNGPGAEAKGIYSSDGLLVEKGSLVRKIETPTIPTNARERRKQMVDIEYLYDSKRDNSYIVMIDIFFESPSLAAAFVLGRSANGRIEWKTGDKKTINDIDEE